MKEDIFKLKNVSYTYDLNRKDANPAVYNLSLNVPQASKISILGANGSGKSTLAKLMKALLFPQEGEVLLLGHPSDTQESLEIVHSTVGMVFQNPDNQIVGTIVEEDVAFGPENIAMPREKMLELIPRAIKEVGLEGMEDRQSGELSGGQKQKLAIAGTLAMEPRVIILDEATSMLDPRSRKEVLEILDRLNKEKGISIINVTHHMEELQFADNLLVMHDGQMRYSGMNYDFYVEDDLLYELHMEKPDYVLVAQEIFKLLDHNFEARVLHTPTTASQEIKNALSIATEEKLNEAIQHLSNIQDEDELTKELNPEVIVSAKNLSYTYKIEEKFSVKALDNISFKINRGEFIGICGSTGSGKSTLVQHLNALIKIQEGQLEVLGLDMSKKASIPEVRKHLGMVMQYPEDQLFEDNIYDEVAFGPKQMKWSKAEIDASVKESLEVLSLDDLGLDRSPFSLSGGQQRRLAIAGILAMKPDILVLDEPAAGLDPLAKQELYAILKDLEKTGVSIIMISHSMDDISKLAEKVLLLHEGKALAYETVENTFANEDLIERAALDLPALMDFAKLFRDKYEDINIVKFRANKLAQELLTLELESRN